MGGLGGVLIFTAIVSRWFYGAEIRSFLIAMAAASFMGTPLIVQTARELFIGKSEMNELAAIGVIATFVSGRFITSGIISFVMFISALLESRSASGARESLEMLISLKPPLAWILEEGEWTESQWEKRQLLAGYSLLSPRQKLLELPS